MSVTHSDRQSRRNLALRQQELLQRRPKLAFHSAPVPAPRATSQASASFRRWYVPPTGRAIACRCGSEPLGEVGRYTHAGVARAHHTSKTPNPGGSWLRRLVPKHRASTKQTLLLRHRQIIEAYPNAQIGSGKRGEHDRSYVATIVRPPCLKRQDISPAYKFRGLRLRPMY